jgi:hypothetical protein
MRIFTKRLLFSVYFIFNIASESQNLPQHIELDSMIDVRYFSFAILKYMLFVRVLRYKKYKVDDSDVSIRFGTENINLSEKGLCVYQDERYNYMICSVSHCKYNKATVKLGITTCSRIGSEQYEQYSFEDHLKPENTHICYYYVDVDADKQSFGLYSKKMKIKFVIKTDIIKWMVEDDGIISGFELRRFSPASNTLKDWGEAHFEYFILGDDDAFKLSNKGLVRRDGDLNLILTDDKNIYIEKRISIFLIKVGNNIIALRMDATN